MITSEPYPTHPRNDPGLHSLALNQVPSGHSQWVSLSLMYVSLYVWFSCVNHWIENIIYPGPANPVQPQDIMNISTHHDRATVQWSVSYIAYTPENYTVNYGRAMNSLNMSVTATQRGDNFTIPTQPLLFSTELTGLDPGVTYYYQVEARNSEGPTLSSVQQFTSAEQRRYTLCVCV